MPIYERSARTGFEILLKREGFIFVHNRGVPNQLNRSAFFSRGNVSFGMTFHSFFKIIGTARVGFPVGAIENVDIMHMDKVRLRDGLPADSVRRSPPLRRAKAGYSGSVPVTSITIRAFWRI